MAHVQIELLQLATGKPLEKTERLYVILLWQGQEKPWFSIVEELLLETGPIGLCMNTASVEILLKGLLVLR